LHRKPDRGSDRTKARLAVVIIRKQVAAALPPGLPVPAVHCRRMKFRVVPTPPLVVARHAEAPRHEKEGGPGSEEV